MVEVSSTEDDPVAGSTLRSNPNPLWSALVPSKERQPVTGFEHQIAGRSQNLTTRAIEVTSVPSGRSAARSAWPARPERSVTASSNAPVATPSALTR